MGLRKEILTIGRVLHQIVYRHLNLDATTTRSKIKIIKRLINTADGIESNEIKAIRQTKLKDNNILSEIKRNSEFCLNLDLF